jgi:4-hydroxy-tetrahydrodipicolinate synthase
MKMAMYLAGIFKSAAVQPPTRPPSAAEIDAIKAALRDAGMLRKEAA